MLFRSKPNAIAEPRCGSCHLEHRGKFLLAEVAEGHCTTCHADLTRHGKDVRLAAVRVTGFRPGRHPQFPDPRKSDRRPLRLNHAAHMPAEPKTVQGVKLPMACSDCHVTNRESPTGDLAHVEFEPHCQRCHKTELQFDVNQLLGAEAPPAPHTKDPAAIRRFITESYQKLLAVDPGIARRPLGRDLDPQPNPAAWLARVVRQSESFLFERKCKYCHEYQGMQGDFPVVKKVTPIRGQFREGEAAPSRWLPGARFSHRAHRAAECVSCHRAARSSAKTEDVLIARMESCLPCHSHTSTAQDQCPQCHLYHDKTKERDRGRRPLEQLTAWLRR